MGSGDVIRQQRWRRWLRVMLPVDIGGTLLAYVVMLGEVQSVIVSGPLLFLAGIVTFLAARVLRHRFAMIVAVAQVGICVLFVSLVNILRWGPSAAERPFQLMGIAYMMGFLPAAVWAFLKVPQVRSFGHCAKCGYMLYGLAEPRCPECGEGFDPAMLPALSRPPEETVAMRDS